MVQGNFEVFKKNVISLLVVGIFLLSAFAVIDMTVSDAEGMDADSAPSLRGSGPTRDIERLSGVIDLNSGDKADQAFYGTKGTRYQYFGSCVKSGDLNNDGFDDYIIGAFGAGSYNGEVYIYYGIKNVHPVNRPSNANVTIAGTGGRAYFGDDLAIGDFNGDGIDDLLVGAQGVNSYIGAAYIFFGRDNMPDKAQWKATNADVTFDGEEGAYSNTYFGWRVAAGDIDGDGYDEPLVISDYFSEYGSYPTYDRLGKMWLWWGRPTADWNSSYDADKGEYDCGIFAKTREPPSGYFYGYSLGQGSNTGDLNGDGADEILMATGRESYFSSETTNSYSSYAGAVHVLEGTLGDRSKWKKDMSLADLTEGNSSYPTQHWIYSSSSSDDFGYWPQVGDMNGDGHMDLITTKGDYNADGAFIFWGNGSMSAFGGASWSTRAHYTDLNMTKVSGVANFHVADFDQDGYCDLYGGNYRENSYNGAVWLWYGKDDWGTGVGSADASFEMKGDYYDYLGYYYYRTLSSGDFNDDGYPDLWVGSYYHRGSGNTYGLGAAYVVLTKPPEMNVKSFELLDGDGEDHDILTPDAGGSRYQPDESMGLIGDGVYTFKIAYNDSWTIVEAQEIKVSFELKSEYLGLAYEFAYSPVNETFYIIEGYGGGIQIVPKKSRFHIIDYNNAEVYLSVRVTTEFLTQGPFDVVGSVSTARNMEYIRYDDHLHVEMDLNFDNEDFTVLREGEDIQRGDQLSGGPPLVVTGLRVVYQDTDVSPKDDKFYVRMTDAYGRIFQNKSSAGQAIYFEIPTNVDSGKYSFGIDIIVNPLLTSKMEDLSVIPDFYVDLDFNGPDAPPLLKFHADSEDDPEGRWDNDDQIWATWGEAFDSQVGIRDYGYKVEGPDGYLEINETSDRGIELELGSDGQYTLYVWAFDNVGNQGLSSMTTLVKDTGPIVFKDPSPTFLGERWYNRIDADVMVDVIDTVPHVNGPSLRLGDLEYALTSSMTDTARDSADWKSARYEVLTEYTEEDKRVYSLSVKVPNLNEGKSNYVWFRVSDEAENMGMTELLDASDENATVYNPSRLWVDTGSVFFDDASPSPEPLESNIVSASIVIEDVLSGVDASSVQYSVSRDGLTNYGGWISAELNVDGPALTAETVSPILFQPGSTNYIRWRAKDVAGNGYTISGDHMINIVPPVVNNPPIAEIVSPSMDDVFNTRETITFDGSGSGDPDLLDELSYQWVLGNRTAISRESVFDLDAGDLERGVHVVTLYVSDGEYTVTDSVSIYVKMHPAELDTDGDGLKDGQDSDDDNDGLEDLEEELIGTNPRLKDSDLDGYNDALDADPLNREITEEADDTGNYSYWDILVLFILLGFLLVLISTMLVFRRRSKMEKEKVMRTVAMEGRVVDRYEQLTGIDAPLLPQVKEMGVSLPPVAAQQVAPVRRAKDLAEKPDLPPAKGEEKEEKKEDVPSEPSPAPEPVPSPEPSPAPSPAPEEPEGGVGETGGGMPGSVPRTEDLTGTASLPGGSDEFSSGGGGTTTCDLCGSTIEVPSGASSVECPLCGEKKEL